MTELGRPNGSGHQSPKDNDDEHEILNRFATAEAKRLFQYMQWFALALGIGIGVEVVASHLEDQPKLHFVTLVLDALGKFLLLCDGAVLALAALVAAILAVNTLLRLIGIDIIAMSRWVGRKIRERHRK